MWQPIETAPRDGTVILLARGAGVYAAYWHPAKGCAVVAEHDKKFPWAFIDPTNGWNGYSDDKNGPTHWMPLPEPPKGA